MQTSNENLKPGDLEDELDQSDETQLPSDVRDDEAEDGEPILDEEDLEENDLDEDDLENIEWEEPQEEKSGSSGSEEKDITALYKL